MVNTWVSAYKAEDVREAIKNIEYDMRGQFLQKCGIDKETPPLQLIDEDILEIICYIYFNEKQSELFWSCLDGI